MDASVVVAVTVVCAPLAELVRGLVAALLGDDTARVAGRLRRPDRAVELLGSVLVPALLGLAVGAGTGWGAPLPVREERLAGGRAGVVAVGLTRPAMHALLALAALLLPTGTLATAVWGVNAAAALLHLLPLPPVGAGALVGLVLDGAAAARWSRWRRWSVGVVGVPAAALAAATGLLGWLAGLV